MTEPVQSALKDAERVTKKQKVCASSTSAGVQSLVDVVQKAREAFLASSGSGAADVLLQLHKKMQDLDVSSQISSNTKELHTAVTKLGKSIEKAFVQDICRAARDLEFDRATLNQVVAEHLFQEGRFDVGEIFVREASITEGDRLKEPFIVMHEVLKEIRQHNLQPALDWIESHREELASQGVPDSFEFKLHRLQYVHVLRKQGQRAALPYARKHFEKFKSTQLREIQRLMGCLVYYKDLERSPYADLLSPDQWDEFAHEFSKQCCGLIGQSCDSPLLVSVAAGGVALPTLLKMVTVMSGQIHDLKSCDQLPVELELGKEFVFHSIFACPVSREQSSPANPPMMLPCGHVLCKHSIVKIAKNNTRSFKCPYCPVEATLGSCKQLHFPDVQ